MISDTYPHNRMQQTQYQRYLRIIKWHMYAVALVVAVMVFSRPHHAFAQVLVIDKTAGSWDVSSDVVTESATHTDWADAMVYNHPVGSGTYLITHFSTRLIRSGTASGNFRIRVTRSGSNPDSATGTFLTAGSVATSAIPTSQNLVVIPVDTPFYVEEGQRYYIKWGMDVCASCDVSNRYIFSAGNNGTWPYFATKSGGNWTLRPTTKMPMGLYGEASEIRSIELTKVTPVGTPSAGQNIVFRAEWQGFFYPDQLKYLFFYPFGRPEGNCGSDGSHCPQIIRVVNNSAQPDGLTGTGAVEFNYTYPFASTYSGTIVASTDCGEFSLNVGYDSCDIERDELSVTVSGLTDDDAEYPDILLDFPVHQGSQGTNRIVGEAQPYEWRIDSGMCPASSVSGVRIFKGYPAPQSSADLGTVLGGSSGSGTLTFDYESPVLKSWFYPYLHVYCANGTFHRIYNGSTTHKNIAAGLYIVDTEWSQYWVAEWEVGGQSSDYSPSGSGAQFFVEKQIVERYEPVRMKFEYNVNFTVGDLAIYPDPSQIGEFYVVDDADYLQENTILNYTISYDSAGTYFPRIRVRSTAYNAGDPSTYRDIWLGGEQTKNNNKFVQVTSGRYSESGLATDDGIFGLDASTFAVSFGDSDNIAITVAETVVTYIAKGALWVASLAYSVLKEAPVFSFFTSTVNPPDGICYQMPTDIFGLEIPPNLDPDGEFCVAYADDDAMFSSTLLAVKMLFGLSILFYVFRKFF